MVEPAVVMEAVKTMGHENRTADEERWPIEQGIPGVLPGVGRQADRLRRQRIDLLRQAGRIHRDLPGAIRPLTRLADRLLRLSGNHHLHGERAAIPKSIPGRSHLCWGQCRVRRGRRDLSLTPRRDQHRCDTQKGMRTSSSCNTPQGSMTRLSPETMRTLALDPAPEKSRPAYARFRNSLGSVTVIPVFVGKPRGDDAWLSMNFASTSCGLAR
jgi:hypothetical protein